jgi:hypothetical protein
MTDVSDDRTMPVMQHGNDLVVLQCCTLHNPQNQSC